MLLAAVLFVLGLAGCGGGEDNGSDGPEGAATPAAQACPPQADEALRDAAVMVQSDDFDGAFATLKPYLDCPEVKERYEKYRPVAARRTLRVARARLDEALSKPGPDNSPQAAVSIARVALRYYPTEEAKAFLRRAEAELAKFKAKYGPKPDEEPGGPPPGAGEGGPPDG